jgi:hypothetical protein
MTATRASLLAAVAALAAGCAGTPELAGAAAARSRGAAVGGGEEAAAPAPSPSGGAPARPARPRNQWLDDDDVRARVNGQVILLRQVRHLIGPGYEEYMSRLDDLTVMVHERTRELVIRRLVVDEGKRIGLSVPDEELARDEERQEKEARKRGSTVELTIKEYDMTRREWDQSRREEILFGMTQYYMAGFAPDVVYSEERFRPCVDFYVSPRDVRAWGERNRAGIDVPESVMLRVLCVNAGDFAGDGVSGAEAMKRCGAALDAFEARLKAGEPFARLADEGYRYPGTASGGLLGPVRRDSPSPPEQLREWAFAPEREPGDVSERMRRGAGFVILYLEKREKAVHPAIEEWGARERARMENLRRNLAWELVKIRLLEEGTVSPPELRASLLKDARADARRYRRQLEPVDPRTGADPVR